MDFNDALDTKQNEIEKPPVQPAGTYGWRVAKVPEIALSKNGEWTMINFMIRSTHAEEDVDEDELAEFGSPKGAMNTLTFMAPTDPDKKNEFEKTLYRVKTFLTDTLRVDVEEDASLREMLDASVGCEFLAQAVWRMSEDGTETYIDVKNYSPRD